MRTNKNSDASADWLVEIGPAHGECMRAATKRNRVLHICSWCNRIVLLRAGATDFGLEGQLVQKKGPWRKGPFFK